MSLNPYLRLAGDGTYELLVPSGHGPDHVLPYCFHTKDDAARWLASRKGREQIKKILGQNRQKERRQGWLGSSAGRVMPRSQAPA